MHAEAAVLTPESADYPAALRGDHEAEFPRLWVLGDTKIVHRDLLGLFCSTHCPGDVILRVYEAARALREAGIPVIGGFHTPMEKECLELLLRGGQPVVWCPARGLPNPRRLPRPRRKALSEGRLLILSPFSGREKRMTAELADLRNDFVAGLADRLLFVYAPPGSKTERLCRKAVAEGKTAWTLAEEHCENLRSIGALAVDLPDLGSEPRHQWEKSPRDL